jgi:hypothetical protein
MQPSIKIKNKSVSWSENLKLRVLDVVLHNGSYYSNRTGKNSEPSASNLDWLFVSSAGGDLDYILFKAPRNNPINRFLEVGDIAQRVIENTKIEGIYNGGDEFLLSNYTIYNSIGF